MKTLLIAAAAAALTLASPAAAQSAQERLDARYDRALAAGYKALFLCGAIANAERIGAERAPESVENWELAGIQAPLNQIVPDLQYEIVRERVYNDVEESFRDGVIDYVAVEWAEDMPPRLAYQHGKKGCFLGPIGSLRANLEPRLELEGDEIAEKMPFLLALPATGEPSRVHELGNPFDPIFERAFLGEYGEGTRTTVTLVRQIDGPDGFSESSRSKPEFEYAPQRTWSVAKSIAATLIGAAVYRGEADVATPAGLGGPFLDRRAEITIDQLLRMASGRYSDTPGNRTDPLYFGGSTVEEAALHWPLVANPGTVFRYANNDTLAAIKAIEPTFEKFPPASFFAAVGMKGTVAETDGAGGYILSSQVWATADDLATLGELYLNDGVTRDGTRILPEGWLEYVSTPSGPQPDGAFGYGAGWWLLNKSEGVPPDTIAAMGNRGQYVVVVPSRNVVIVRRGEDPVGARFDIAAFTRDVLAALD